MSTRPRLIYAQRNDQTRDLTSRELTLRADTYDDERRTVEAVLATENPVMVYDWMRDELVEEVLVIADDMALPGQVPLLDSHSRWSVSDQLGSTRNLRIESRADGSRVIVGDRHLGDTQRARDAAAMIRDGHLTDGSIGYQVTASSTVDPGESITIADRTFTNDSRYTRRYSTAWVIREDSLTPIGADPAAKSRHQAALTHTCNPPQGRQAQKGHAMKFTFSKWLKLRGLSLDDLIHDDLAAKRSEFDALTDEQFDHARAEYEQLVQREQAEQVSQREQAAPIEQREQHDTSDVARQAVVAERQRTTAIRALAGDDVDSAIIERAISEGHSLEQARAAVLEHIRTSRPPAAQIGGFHDRRQDMARAMSDAIVMDATGRRPEGDQAQRNAQDFRGIGLQESARQFVRAYHTGPVPTTPDTLFRAAASINDWTNVLGDASNRSLLAGYQEEVNTARIWCGEDFVNDFRDHNVIATSAFADLEKVGSDGKLNSASMSDKAETQSVNTYGKKWVITRQTFINDDLGAITRVPMLMGAAAQSNIADLVYDTLALNSGMGPTMSEDSEYLFSDSHAQDNLATSALDAAGLTAVKTLLRKHKSLAGRAMNLSMAYLLVPAALEDDAAVLLNSRELFLAAAGDTDATTQKGSANPHQGLAQLVIESRLDDIDATAWYAIANQRLRPAIQIVYLRGSGPNPVVERLPADGDLTLGWRVYHDVGVGVVDWRGVVLSTGGD